MLGTRKAWDRERTINIFIDEEPPIVGARIRVIGVGGGGGNAVSRMFESGIVGVDFIVANTDLQALKRSRVPTKIQLGSKLTKGLGAGADPEIGRQAALEDTDKIIGALEDSDMVFVTTGLGGGTGTGAAPIVAALASELGALTVAIVTQPFHFEGRRRMQQAENGLNELHDSADTILNISNERLFASLAQSCSLADAFDAADDVLRQAVQGITDLITIPGFINLDFADVRTIMQGMGLGLMGTGCAVGENRAVEATRKAVSSPLLENVSLEGARGILINITGGSDIGLWEINEAASMVRRAADENANIIFGHVVDETMIGSIKVTVIATGLEMPKRDLNTLRANVPRLLDYPIRKPNSIASTLRPQEDNLDIPTFLRKIAD